jgi:hypothetical protein
VRGQISQKRARPHEPPSVVQLQHRGASPPAIEGRSLDPKEGEPRCPGTTTLPVLLVPRIRLQRSTEVQGAAGSSRCIHAALPPCKMRAIREERLHTHSPACKIRHTHTAAYVSYRGPRLCVYVSSRCMGTTCYVRISSLCLQREACGRRLPAGMVGATRGPSATRGYQTTTALRSPVVRTQRMRAALPVRHAMRAQWASYRVLPAAKNLKNLGTTHIRCLRLHPVK